MTDTSVSGADESVSSTRSRVPSKSLLTSLARDFLLIVTGVLTALALENWNGAYKERRLENEYLRALAADARAHVAQYDDWKKALTRHKAWTDTIWGWANGATPEQPVERVLLWMRLGGQLHLNTYFPNGAYQDLVNSGKLSLIRNRSLREALINYNNALARWNDVIESNGQTAADRYTAAVTDLIPPDIRWRAALKQDLASVALAAVLTEFRTRPAVRHALVAMAESHDFRAEAADRSQKQALALLKQLESELGR